MIIFFQTQPSTEHPHGLPDRDLRLFTHPGQAGNFNFHGYPWLIHRLAYRRHNDDNMHVRGYRKRATSTRRWSWRSTTISIASAWRWTSSTVCQGCRGVGGHAKEKFLNHKLMPQLRARVRHRQTGCGGMGLGDIKSRKSIKMGEARQILPEPCRGDEQFLVGGDGIGEQFRNRRC